VIILPIVILGVIVPISDGLLRDRTTLLIGPVYELRQGQEPGIDG
jgi:hypothetical protein